MCEVFLSVILPLLDFSYHHMANIYHASSNSTSMYEKPTPISDFYQQYPDIRQFSII